MDRFAKLLGITGLALFIGCGSPSESQVAQQSAPEPTAAAPASNDAVASPSDVVSQFLDEVRRGGENSRANDYLTEVARTELNRIGQSVTPMGSPDARYQVTRAEPYPGDENSMLVHSVWSEPSESGPSVEIQVVWALQRESAGWRISGLAIQEDENSEPVVLDFENAEMMAQQFSSASAAEESAAVPQATNPAAAISR